MSLDEIKTLKRSLLTRKFSDERPCPVLCAIENAELEEPKWEKADAEGREAGSGLSGED